MNMARVRLKHDVASLRREYKRNLAVGLFEVSIHHKYSRFKEQISAFNNQYCQMKWWTDPLWIRRFLLWRKTRKIAEKVSLMEEYLPAHLSK
ncbi:hypothetical protein J4219_04110 [Candidatus Woesearchaeota archaeon]|nr:hypothetical protein [Candidatus Woesearchaeota archaeon]